MEQPRLELASMRDTGMAGSMSPAMSQCQVSAFYTFVDNPLSLGWSSVSLWLCFVCWLVALNFFSYPCWHLCAFWEIHIQILCFCFYFRFIYFYLVSCRREGEKERSSSTGSLPQKARTPRAELFWCQEPEASSGVLRSTGTQAFALTSAAFPRPGTGSCI